MKFNGPCVTLSVMRVKATIKCGGKHERCNFINFQIKFHWIDNVIYYG